MTLNKEDEQKIRNWGKEERKKFNLKSSKQVIDKFYIKQKEVKKYGRIRK